MLQIKLTKLKVCYKILKPDYLKKGMMIKVLSKRENEIAAEVAKDFSVKEIAERLCLSPYTVDTHIKNAKSKLGVRGLSGLTREFVMSLEDPKQFFRTATAIVFLALHISISLFTTDVDLRKPRPVRSRTARRIDI